MTFCTHLFCTSLIYVSIIIVLMFWSVSCKTSWLQPVLYWLSGSSDKTLWAVYHTFLNCQKIFHSTSVNKLIMGHVSNFFPVFFVGVSTKPSTSLSNPSSMEVTIAEVAVINVSCVFFFSFCSLHAIIFLHTIACCINFQWFEVSVGPELFTFF